MDVRALRLLRMRLRQEHRARTEVIAADFRRRERLGVLHVGVADDRDVVAVGLERLQARRRQIEVAADGGRRPQVASSTPSAVLPAEPCTISMHADADLAGAAALRLRRPAGTIASSNGSARVTPMPFSTVRREMCFFVRYVTYSSSCAYRPSASRRLRPAAGSLDWSSSVRHLRHRNAALLTTPRMNADIR